jgi:thiol-disulfide isomerase/thioredoxin
MTRVSLSLLRALFLLSAVVLASAGTASAGDPEVKGGRLEFALPDLEGNMVESSDARFKNKVVFVTLWGTWCTPCRTEIPTFNDLQNRYGDEGLVVVGIAFERDTLAADRRDTIRRFSEKYEIDYLVLDGGATTDFSEALPMVGYVTGLPIEIIINRSGVVVECRNGYGYKKRWARKLERSIKRWLAEEP